MHRALTEVGQLLQLQSLLQRPDIMRRIEATSAGTPGCVQPAPLLTYPWRFRCPFQRRTAERYKGAAIPVLTLPCQDGTDSSNPLSSSDESRANLTFAHAENSVAASRKPIPTVLITAYRGGSVRERALTAGVIGYLSKPFEEDDLLVCIRAALTHACG